MNDDFKNKDSVNAKGSEIQLVGKLVYLPIRVWKKLYDNGFNIPRADFDLTIFLKGKFKEMTPVEIVACMTERIKIRVLRSIVQCFINDEELYDAIKILHYSESPLAEKIKNMLCICTSSYRGVYDLDATFDITFDDVAPLKEEPVPVSQIEVNNTETVKTTEPTENVEKSKNLVDNSTPKTAKSAKK